MAKLRPKKLVLLIASVLAVGAVQAATVDSWNSDNVVTDLPNWPPGADPSHTPGVTYDSTLYTNTGRSDTNGAVIWKEGSVVSPGAQVLTEAPGTGDNCIITSGTNRAIPGAVPKTCTDEFQSAKRVKVDARLPGDGVINPDPDGSIVLTDGKPLDMVFEASAPDGTDRAYRVFKKYINATEEAMDGFVVELGFGTGDGFVPSSAGDGLKFTKRQKGNNPNIPDFEPLPFYSTPPGDSDLGSLMSAGLFGDAADNKNRNIDGYFGLPEGVAPWPDPACDPDPSGTGRAYWDLVVRTEDRIETAGDVQGLHYCLFGNMLPQGGLPLGYFWDDDGDPVTDADTIADWDGSGQSPACGGAACWETYVVLDTDPASPNYGDPVLDADGNFTRPANPPVAVPDHVIDFWVANPEPEVPDGSQFYFIAALDDMGLTNDNYHITVESIDTWPTYDAFRGTASFTMRTSSVGSGTALDAPWLATLPPQLPAPPAVSDLAVAAFTVDGDSPATVDEGTEVEVAVTLATAANQPAASGRVLGEATDADGKPYASFLGVFTDLAAGSSTSLSFNWLVADSTGLPDALTWTVTAELDGGDANEADNSASVDVTINAAPTSVDVSLDVLALPRNMKNTTTEDIQVVILNAPDSEEAASGTVTVTAAGTPVFSDTFTGLPVGERREFIFGWTAPEVSRREMVEIRATVEADGDQVPTNDTAVGEIRVTPGRGR